MLTLLLYRVEIVKPNGPQIVGDGVYLKLETLLTDMRRNYFEMNNSSSVDSGTFVDGSPPKNVEICSTDYQPSTVV